MNAQLIIALIAQYKCVDIMSSKNLQYGTLINIVFKYIDKLVNSQFFNSIQFNFNSIQFFSQFNSKFIPISNTIYNIKHNKKEDNEKDIEGMTKGQRGP